MGGVDDAEYARRLQEKELKQIEREQRQIEEQRKIEQQILVQNQSRLSQGNGRAMNSNNASIRNQYQLNQGPDYVIEEEKARGNPNKRAANN